MPTDRRFRILIAEPDDFPTESLELLSSVGELQLGRTSSLALGLEFNSFDVVFVRLAEMLEPVQLDQSSESRKVKILVSPTTGLDHIDLEWCAREGIDVVSLRGEIEFLRTVRATAEHTLALTLALHRNLIPAVNSTLSGNWNRDAFRGSEIAGSTVGLVGLGRLGQMMASIYEALSARVIGYDPDSSAWPESVERMETLRDLLTRSDIVSLHASYVRGMQPILGAVEFESMKPSALLVNTARGGLVDEQALLNALKKGEIEGAALDVLNHEPPLGISPLIEYAQQSHRLIVTPHIAGNTRESRSRAEKFVTQKVVEKLVSVGLR